MFIKLINQNKTMKVFYLIILSVALFSCNTSNPEFKDQQANQETVYDSVLAQQYSADAYGMKQYVIAFLKRGSNRSTDSIEAAQLQKAHLQNINRLAKEGKLLIAGPFLDNGEIRGIYIFDVKTIEEAQKLTETDPAIQKGSLVMDLHPWYGSAALMAVPDVHKKLEKKGIIE